MNENTWIILFVIALIISVLWMGFQWGLCRDAGLSFWYCFQHTFG